MKLSGKIIDNYVEELKRLEYFWAFMSMKGYGAKNNNSIVINYLHETYRDDKIDINLAVGYMAIYCIENKITPPPGEREWLVGKPLLFFPWLLRKIWGLE